MPWTADDMPSMDGKTVVVTGANSGLGFEATRKFADAEANVVMACRSLDRAEDAADEVRDEIPDASLDVRELDLASLSSVESFADGFTEDYDELHVLCNNAGVMAIPRSETEDGFETQFGVNHLGHFALTGHLLGALISTEGGSRVVVTSSGYHRRGEIDFDDLHGRDDYGDWDAYAQSKLANLLFVHELERRLDEAGVESVKAVGTHPGYAATNLQKRSADEGGSLRRKLFMKFGNVFLAQSSEMGALPLLYAAVADDIEGGKYVGPGGFKNMRGYPSKQEPSEDARDDETAKRLWEVSEGETGVEYDFP